MNLAKKIVNRMTDKSLHSGGKYVSVHLRFEEVNFHFRLKVICEYLCYCLQLKMMSALFSISCVGHGGFLVLCV